METGFLITARLKSTRLPGKIMLELNDRPVISHMIKRLKLSKAIDRIILCTSTNPRDRPLIDIAALEDIDCFSGSEEDVILRLYEASREFKLDYAIDVTADCPLVSLEYIEAVAGKYRETGADFIRCEKLPVGLYSWGLKIDAMRRVCEMKKSGETEVWGRYFTESGQFDVIDIDIPREYIRPDYRLTLDYPEDFELLKKIFEHFGEGIYQASTLDIIGFLDDNPQVAGINRHCQGLYKERWESQNRLAKW